MSQCLTRNSIRAGTVENDLTFLDNSGNSNPVTQISTHPTTPAVMSTHHLADDDTPASSSQEAEATAFAEAIGKVLKTNNSSKPKLWELDPLDGSDSRKLHTFILQCKLNFRDCPDQFQDDTTKVNYILSHLKGSTLDCFEPALLDPIEPIWLSDLNLFIEELETNFGTYNPVGE